MVCPFCDHRNLPGSSTCSSCGAILRGAAAEKRLVRRGHGGTGATRVIAWAAAGLIAGVVLGVVAAYLLAPHRTVLLALIGALLGVMIGAAAGGGRRLYLNYLYRARHAALQARVHSAVTTAAERYEKELKSPQVPMQTRLNLAALHLLKDENEKAMQTLQTAQGLKASGGEFENNVGVALARRGSLPQALDWFQRAAARPDAPAQPHGNQAHVLINSLADPAAVDQALISVRNALSRAGNNPIYFDLLGLAFARDQRLGEAKAQFERALQLADGTRTARADARNNLGVLRRAEGAKNEAAADFAAALEADPGHAHALANQGLAQYLDGEKEPALHKIMDAAHLDARSPDVQAIAGFALCSQGAVNDGIRASRQALTLAGYLFEPHANLGKAYADSGLPDVAEHYLVRAGQLQPRSWQVMQTAGVVKVALGQVPPAVSFFESALHIHPQSAPLLINHAVALALMGRDEEAKRRLEQAMRLDRDNPLLHGHWGWIYLREDSATLAAGEIEIALQKEGRSGVLHNNLGLAQIGQGAYEVALESLRRALRRDPDLHPVHYHIGAVHALLKDPDQAVKAWEIAAKHELSNPDCFTNLGAAYYRKGNFDTAVSHFRHVLQLRQDRPEDYSNLGLSYAKQGVALRKSAESVSKATALIGLGAADEKMKQSLDKQKQAIEMFDRALALDPRNVIIHSNRGLACFFANRAEDAMAEWANVTRIDPLYARRRGQKQQTEFDDSQVDFIPLDVPKRAMMLPLATADYLPRFAWGYDTDQWQLIVSDPPLADLPEQVTELRALERIQRALSL